MAGDTRGGAHVTNNRAIDLAIAAMQRERRRYAVDAALHERMGLDSPSAVRASETRKELAEAIARLEAMKTKQEVMELG